MWFRRDLRISDNDALWHAANAEGELLCIFTLDPHFFTMPSISPARRQFMIECLQNLDKNLRAKGGRLRLLTGDSTESMQRLLSRLLKAGYQVELYKNRDRMGAYGKAREQAVESFCAQNSIGLYNGSAYFLLDSLVPHPEWTKHYYIYQEQKQWRIPDSMNSAEILIENSSELDIDSLTNWVQDLGVHLTAAPGFHGGESSAQKTLKSFLTDRYKGYHWKISQPYFVQHGATSRLSPHIALGTISTRQINHAAYQMKQRLKRDAPHQVVSLASFLSRLRWRDSFTQRYYLQPELVEENAYREFDEHYNWQPLDKEHAAYFEHWKYGTTGFPLLDASMRQLNAQGFMNFRMRAQAVTMLTIIFGVSWQWGARYFMQKLVDGDIAINHWQWQMQAGIVNPLSPVFRIYNPDKNLRERDPKLAYIREWCPEYDDCISPDEVLKKANPIVNWSERRKVNGKIISELRKQTRERLLKEEGDVLRDANDLLRSTQRIAREYATKNVKRVK